VFGSLPPVRTSASIDFDFDLHVHMLDRVIQSALAGTLRSKIFLLSPSTDPASRAKQYTLIVDSEQRPKLRAFSAGGRRARDSPRRLSTE